jgi:hypothetical protein
MVHPGSGASVRAVRANSFFHMRFLTLSGKRQALGLDCSGSHRQPLGVDCNWCSTQSDTRDYGERREAGSVDSKSPQVP